MGAIKGASAGGMGGSYGNAQGYGNTGATGDRGAAGGTATKTALPRVQRSNADVVQIRFVDYTVEPELTYQYRVKVVMVNPNGPTAYPPVGRPDVEYDEIAEAATIESEDWSDPTNPVYVPGDREFYVLDRTRSRDEAKVEVHHWLRAFGDWALNPFQTKPGDVIGAEVKDFKMVDAKDALQKISVNFTTEDLLLDVTGSTRAFNMDGIEYREPIPAEIFVVDRLGDLSSQSEDYGKNHKERKAREEDYTKVLAKAKQATKDEKEKQSKPETGGADGFQERVPKRSGT